MVDGILGKETKMMKWACHVSITQKYVNQTGASGNFACCSPLYQRCAGLDQAYIKLQRHK
eukprot:8920205-Ditylum_brightwellii.AAC.1